MSKYLSSDQEKVKKKALKYSGEYELVFSLLVGNPNDATVSWEAEQSMEELDNILQLFSNFTSFQVSSQIQNYASLPLIPTEEIGEHETVYKLFPKDLTHFINSEEWSLTSAVSTAPEIHFLLYIPSHSTSPLMIVHSDGTELLSNAFLIPQWGGIVVENFPRTGDHKHLSKADLHPIMETFAQQLLTLLGVVPIKINPEMMPKFDFETEPDTMYGITGWEFDRLLRRNAVQNIADSISTLQSLSSMLQTLETIAVQDNVALLVKESMRSFKEASERLKLNDCEQAAQYARDAILSAEKAFFDPNMVSMLYFPAEHLLAIYMPFFVPILVPMVTAMYKEFKVWQMGRRKVKVE